MLDFITQHPVQSSLILFAVLGVFASFEILFRRVFRKNQITEENGLKIIRKGRSVEIIDEHGSRVFVESGGKGKIVVNGKTVELK